MAMSKRGQEAVLNLRRYGIVVGTPSGMYAPSKVATRAEIAVILRNFLTKVMSAVK